ncbi:MAG: hypothetical protein AAGK21_04455, partial [Bacteroidota bacterium]
RQRDIRQRDIRQRDIRQRDIRQRDIRQRDIRQRDIRQREKSTFGPSGASRSGLRSGLFHACRPPRPSSRADWLRPH